MTVSRGASAVWEVLLSLHMLQQSDGRAIFGGWRRRTQAAVRPEVLDRLRRLAPPRGYSADFLTPSGEDEDFEAGLDRILSTPKWQFDAQLGRVAKYRAPSAWTAALGSGHPRVVEQLGEALRTYHSAAIAPHWQAINTRVAGGNGRVGDEIGRIGLDQVLSTLGPGIRWKSPVLEIDSMIGPDVHLQGRGLRLQYSAFCWQAPTKLLEPDATPILVLPLPAHAGPFIGQAATRSGQDRVSALIGGTRSAVLEATVTPCTTTVVARLCAVSLGTASYQLSILREGGLIRSDRRGPSVEHRITPLGLRLLSATGEYNTPTLTA
ncbi:helix-turn-helix domain-containing protein [Kribbella sp. NPDC056951]|uniref:helix-turn-helix domain-containing protein n=1 Tax=Kribbella sp. NPDC056951 TaxID=3345978 RepID=UPI003642A9BE